MVSWKKVAIAFFYNTIKSLIRQVAGGFLGSLATVPDDLIMALIGYLVSTRTQYKEEGEALLLASVASLGATAGTLFVVQAQPAPTPTPAPAPTPRAPAPAPAPTAPRAVITPVTPPRSGRKVIMVGGGRMPIPYTWTCTATIKANTPAYTEILASCAQRL